MKVFPIEDHNVPTFEQLYVSIMCAHAELKGSQDACAVARLEFCEHAAAWLDADPNHVVALHCKVRTRA